MVKIHHFIILFIVTITAMPGAFSSPRTCRQALESHASAREKIKIFGAQKKRELTDFEIEEVLEKNFYDLLKETEAVSDAFQDNPAAITLLNEIEMVNVGTEAVLGHAKAISKNMDPGLLKKMFQEEEKRQSKIQELAEEIKICRSQTEICMTTVQAKVAAVIKSAQKMGDLISRIDSAIEELSRASIELPEYQTGIGSFVLRLQFVKSAFQGYLVAVEKGFPTLHDAETGFKTLVDTLALLAERGAPSIVTEVLSADGLRAQHEEKIRLKLLALVSPKVIKMFEDGKDRFELAIKLTREISGKHSYTDADFLYIFENFPRIEKPKYDISIGISNNHSNIWLKKRLLPDKEWAKSIEAFNALVDFYEKTTQSREWEKSLFLDFYSSTITRKVRKEP